VRSWSLGKTRCGGTVRWPPRLLEEAEELTIEEALSRAAVVESPSFFLRFLRRGGHTSPRAPNGGWLTPHVAAFFGRQPLIRSRRLRLRT
jgi:hypothetical protein